MGRWPAAPRWPRCRWVFEVYWEFDVNWVFEMCVYEDRTQDRGGLHGLRVRGELITPRAHGAPLRRDIYDFEMDSYERHFVKGVSAHDGELRLV